MALLTFDGFETYGVIPTTTAATGVRAQTPVGAAGWTGTAITTNVQGLTIGRPNSSVDPDRRSWLSTLYGATKPTVSTAAPWNYFVKTFPVAGDTVVFGFKLVISDVNVGGSDAAYDQGICRIGHGAHSVDIMLSYAGTTGSYNISAYRNAMTLPNFNDTQNTGIKTAVFGLSNWAKPLANTIEISANKTTGLFTVWVNNAYVGTYTNTPSASPIDYGTRIQFGEWSSRTATSSAAVAPVYMTDFYAIDSAGAAPTTRLGKVKVVTRVPTADVLATFSRPVSAASNAAVAGQIPPSSTNFLTGVNDGDTDLYSAPAFAFSNESIIATAIVTSGYKTDATGNNLMGTLKIGDTVYPGPEIALPVGNAYVTSATIFMTNPATGLKFTKAELDAAAFGMRVKAPTT